jgi:hypothetical protein
MIEAEGWTGKKQEKKGVLLDHGILMFSSNVNFGVCDRSVTPRSVIFVKAGLISSRPIASSILIAAME